MNEGRATRVAYVTVVDGDEEATVAVPVGATLRDALRERGYSPYTRLTERANCGGRGICATCGVRIEAAGRPIEGEETGAVDGAAASESSDGSDGPVPGESPAPEHWHDRLAARAGYPRLSCQITVDRDLVVRIPEKRIWGGREERAQSSAADGR